MIKLKFDSLSLSQFSTFKFIPKKHRIVNSDKKITTTLIKGICIKDDDEYKIQINVKALKPNLIDEGQPDLLLLDFTEESYNLKGLNVIFSREKDEKGRYIQYIRDDSKAKFHPGNTEKYVPFCHNWVCSGYIIRRNGKMLFDFNQCISPNGYNVTNIDDD